MTQLRTVETAATATAAKLIADLQRTMQVLREHIAAEEQRLQKFNPAAIDYPLIARMWGERCQNLRATIAFLEGRQATQ